MKEYGALQYSLPLGFFVHGQQDLQIVGIAEIGMGAVCAFYDDQLLGSNSNRHGKGKGAAIKGAVGKSLSGFQRKRILERPAFLHKRFFEEWIPMENRYFEAFRISDRSEIIL